MSRLAAFPFLAVLVLALLVAAPGRGARDAPGKPEDRGRLKISLSADPAVGFTPMTTMLTGHLSGVAPKDANFCHPAVTWVRVSPGQTEDNASRYHEDPACLHPESETEAATTFTKVFDLYQPGPYLFKLIVEGKDRRRVESVYMRVEVLRTQ